eukprot:NODE_12809_length_1202_cov_7.526512.p1 GENE.NODE_12809_length_1202_cov_7.526512~~NODE_12809_length_1202_cov_7.526512.p1  ORF type:complete len:256 (+),score=83.76 NODE_12809_length_1202_cov_7.526512:116-883(+)
MSGIFDLVVQLVEQDNFLGELIRAVRQGIYFGVETRVPYAITQTIRPYLFKKSPRPLANSLQNAGKQCILHGALLAQLAVVFKVVERVLATMQGCAARPRGWHTFVAGSTAGYFVFVRNTANASLKRQVNMAIGVRTIYAVASMLVRKGLLPGFRRGEEGYAQGRAIWITLMWGTVMWHWKHQTSIAPGEMNVEQVKSMSFIYTGGDRPDVSKWLGSNYVALLALMLALRSLPTVPEAPQQAMLSAAAGLDSPAA